MAEKHGNLSINSENIFPIIKKWMYSDKDIFVRELISNACDAITKRKKLALAGECELPEDYKPRIEVITDDVERTLTFIDNGLGMTADEVEEYIAQIAFSGATEFLEKYKDKADADQIIGHFGLGFYSAFMVADRVVIDTLSYKEGARPAMWDCDGSTEYVLDEGSRTTVGTTITLHINDDSLEFSNEYKVRETLEKYCRFMPYEIFVYKNAPDPVKTSESTASEKADEKKEEPKPVNDIHPLWTKNPSECTDDDYKTFYRRVFNDYKEPLFWIHLNMDYPFNLKGILYFPRIGNEYDAAEGKIKLYNNQVFIADNIKEVIPEYLLVLKGVIDCPDLPLNVSRSALQNDGFVNKISDYISKKVADKLSGMCKVSREDYEKYWDDIAPFIKYGCMKDEKFGDKMLDYILYKDLDGKYSVLDDIVPKDEQMKPEKTEEDKKEGEAEAGPEEDEELGGKIIYYVTDTKGQSQYINLFKAEDKKAYILDRTIDVSFVTYVEQKKTNVRFLRIDSGIQEDLTDGEEISAEDAGELEKIFRKAAGNDTLAVKTENLKNEKLASVITISEEDRRMMEVMRLYGMSEKEVAGFEPKPTLVLNKKHPLVSYILEHKRSKNGQLVAEQLYDLALLANRPLSPEEMTRFVERSNDIMLKILK
ncbi:MAG: molecular chaperone HtpG [Lachnospiraceae bacterium]|nr:molecular chaperone HtpG [Lachnospiraceae bacterium]